MSSAAACAVFAYRWTRKGSKTCTQRDANGPRRAWRDVRIAVGVHEIDPVKDILDVDLQPSAIAEREERSCVRARVSRQDDCVVNGGEHIRPMNDANSGAHSRQQLICPLARTQLSMRESTQERRSPGSSSTNSR